MKKSLNDAIIENKAIYLQLTLQERTVGLNEIVAEWSSYFGLDIYFWNLAQTEISHLNQTQNIKPETKTAEPKKAPQATVESAIKSAKTNDPIISRPEEILSRLIEIYHSNNEGIYIVENIDTLINSQNIRIIDRENFKTWLIKITTAFREKSNFYLVLLGNSEEWKLQNAIPQVKLPYLTIDEIQTLLEKRFTELKLQNYEKTHLIAKAAHILLGLTKPELEWGIQLITNSLVNERSVDRYLVELLEYKIDKLKDLGLKFLPPKAEVEVGGMDILKGAIEQMANESLPEARIDKVPLSVAWMLAGVPGAGKSLIARYIAQKLRLPLIYISLDSIVTKGVGYLASILERVEAAAPVIVYFDEFDKLFPKVETEQTTAIKGFTLTWLQEKKDECFVLATLNRLDALPPEMTRSGRFDYIWYVGFPQPIERLEIFKYHLKTYDQRFKNGFDYSKEQWQMILNKSIGFTGAEIESVIKKAVRKKYKLKCQKMKVIQDKINNLKTLVTSWIDPDHFSQFEYQYIRDFNSIQSAIACNPEILIEGKEQDIIDSLEIINQSEQELEIAKSIKLEIDFETLLNYTTREIPLAKRDPERVNAIENRAKDVGTPVASKDTSKLIDDDGTFWPEKPKVQPESTSDSNHTAPELTANQKKIKLELEEELDPAIKAAAGFFN